MQDTTSIPSRWPGPAPWLLWAWAAWVAAWLAAASGGWAAPLRHILPGPYAHPLVLVGFAGALFAGWIAAPGWGRTGSRKEMAAGAVLWLLGLAGPLVLACAVGSRVYPFAWETAGRMALVLGSFAAFAFCLDQVLPRFAIPLLTVLAGAAALSRTMMTEFAWQRSGGRSEMFRFHGTSVFLALESALARDALRPPSGLAAWHVGVCLFLLGTVVCLAVGPRGSSGEGAASREDRSRPA